MVDKSKNKVIKKSKKTKSKEPPKKLSKSEKKDLEAGLDFDCPELPKPDVSNIPFPQSGQIINRWKARVKRHKTREVLKADVDKKHITASYIDAMTLTQNWREKLMANPHHWRRHREKKAIKEIFANGLGTGLRNGVPR